LLGNAPKDHGSSGEGTGGKSMVLSKCLIHKIKGAFAYFVVLGNSWWF
jgi:hypothetical protein